MDLRDIIRTLLDEHLAYEKRVADEAARTGLNEERVRDQIGVGGNGLTNLPDALEKTLQEWVWNHTDEAAAFVKQGG